MTIRILLVTLALAMAAGAQLTRLEFAVDPPDTRVMLVQPGAPPRPIGTCAAPVEVDAAMLATHPDFLLQRDGWEDRSVTYEEVAAGRFPASGRFAMRPAADGAGARLAYQAGRFWWVGLLALSPLLLLLRKQPQVDRLASLRSETDPDDPLALTLVGGYRLVSLLGEGATATVYRAVPETSLKLSEAVAVKLLRPQECLAPEFRRRFSREMRLAQKLSHPSFVRIHQVGDEGDRLFLVMELLEGETLQQRLEKGPLTEAELVQLFTPLLEGLQEAHASGVAHRDLKPANLFVTREGQLKLLDFGLAKGEGFSAVTATGMGVGTPTYMAPEQAQGQAGPASDQYSLGVIFYECLSGKPPFSDPSPLKLVFLHTTKKPRPLQSPLEPVVARMLAKAPEQRYPDLDAVRAAL